MRAGNLSILILFMMIACIDSVNLNVGTTVKTLVVDGMITNAPGPYRVRLVWSSTVGEVLLDATPVTAANVTISDDQGLAETLSDLGSGIYQTNSNGIRGITGKTYHVNITTPDGQSYSSTPELLSAPGTIDSVYFEFKFAEAIVNGRPLEADGFNIYVNARGNEQHNLLRWTWTGNYKVLTHPELEYGMPPRMPRPYAPAPCSGYICADNPCFHIRMISGCACCTCYITQNQVVPMLSDNLLANNVFQKYRVAFIPFVPRNFLEKYHVKIQQFTITESTYQFWKLVQSQITGNANLFQPPIAKIRGNIISANGSGKALGIFSACGLAEKTTWIYANDVPYVFEYPIIRESCQVLDPTSTITPPSFWY